MPARRRIVRIVVAPTRCPSPWSSPLIRITPHLGFALAICTIRRTSAGSSGGRPALRYRNVHLRLTSSRCQRRIVAGDTMNPLQRSRSSRSANAAITIRSRRRRRGRGFDRFKTASW